MTHESEILIRELAAKLGKTAEHLWEVLLMKVYIDFYTVFAFFILSSIGAARLIPLLLKKITKPKATPENRYPVAEWTKDEAVLAGWLGIVIVSACVAFSAIQLLTMLPAIIINPESLVIKFLLGK